MSSIAKSRRGFSPIALSWSRLNAGKTGAARRPGGAPRAGEVAIEQALGDRAPHEEVRSAERMLGDQAWADHRVEQVRSSLRHARHGREHAGPRRDCRGRAGNRPSNNCCDRRLGRGGLRCGSTRYAIEASAASAADCSRRLLSHAPPPRSRPIAATNVSAPHLDGGRRRRLISTSDYRAARPAFRRSIGRG